MRRLDLSPGRRQPIRSWKRSKDFVNIFLRRGTSEMRLLITADLDYPCLLALAQAEGPRLILLRGGDYGEQEAIGRLRRALEMIPSEELPRSIVVIEKRRIRRRSLPLGLSG